MKFSYNWLQSFFIKKLPSPGNLSDLLTLHFAEVEGVEKSGDDFVLDIDVRPNRAGDCFSHLGVAREISAILSYKLQPASYKLIEDNNLKTKDFISVDVKHLQACPRYTARALTNVKVFPSPKWLQERLISCGLRPINNVVDATNYVMLEVGQPLHAFDAGKIEGKQITVRFAKEGEKITTLDNENYDLGKNILVIADKNSPLAIAGIKGGKKAEIDKKTKTIVIESANFNSRVVRLGSKAVDLKTDASLRFEHGVDPNLTEPAIDRVAVLIQKTAGGMISQGKIDFYPKKTLPRKIKLELDCVKNLLGVEIPEAIIKKILESLGFGVKGLGPRFLDVEVPTKRLDVNSEENLIEEIGRIYGYEKIPAVFPLTNSVPPERNANVFWENSLKNVLKEAGFTESLNYSFISARDAEILKYKKEDLLELENPLSSDFQYLRPSLIPNLLKNMERNQRNSKELKMFELGKIFGKNIEKRMLTAVLTGDKFYEAKGVIDGLAEKMGVNNVQYNEYKAEPEEIKSFVCYQERAAVIGVGREKVGLLGEILPRVQAGYKIESRTVLFEIDFELLAKLANEEKEYQPLSRFPQAGRDIAILVPKSVKAKEVLEKVQEACGQLLRGSDLFDIYEGDNLPPGKKNLAFHLIFQAKDRTLSSREIDELQNKIIAALEKEPEWRVRR